MARLFIRKSKMFPEKYDVMEGRKILFSVNSKSKANELLKIKRKVYQKGKMLKKIKWLSHNYKSVVIAG